MLTPKQKRDLDKAHAAASAYFRRLGKAGRKAHTAPATAAANLYHESQRLPRARARVARAQAKLAELQAIVDELEAEEKRPSEEGRPSASGRRAYTPPLREAAG
jgi:hypothetical protein